MNSGQWAGDSGHRAVTRVALGNWATQGKGWGLAQRPGGNTGTGAETEEGGGAASLLQPSPAQPNQRA